MAERVGRVARRTGVAAAAALTIGAIGVGALAGTVDAAIDGDTVNVIDLAGASSPFDITMAHNPERREYLVVWNERLGANDGVHALRLDRDGQALGSRFQIAVEGTDMQSRPPEVAYNPDTDQYAVVFERSVGTNPGGGQTSHVFAQLVDDTGGLVGGEVMISPDFGAYFFCAAMEPDIAFDSTSGGYLVAYTKDDALNADPGLCDGLPADAGDRLVIQSVGADLTPGALTLGPNPGNKTLRSKVEIVPHASNGTFMVMEEIDFHTDQTFLTGRAYIYESDRTLVREIELPESEPAGYFGEVNVASDPVTGNWLLMWVHNRVSETITHVVDASGTTVVAPHVGVAGYQVSDVVAVGDGTFVAWDAREGVVQLDGNGDEFFRTAPDGFGDTLGIGGYGAGGIGVDVLDGTPQMVVVGNAADVTDLATLAAVPAPPGMLPLAPARLLETRSGPGLTTIDGEFEGIGKRAAGSTLTLQVAGRGGVPADSRAVTLNIAEAGADGNGYLTAYPCDADRPTASSLNYRAGVVASSAVFVKLSAAGTVCIFTLAAADLIVDATAHVPVIGSVTPVVPARLLETRSGPGLATIDGSFLGIGRVPAGGEVELTVAGRGGVDADADAALITVTAVFPSEATFLTIYPCGAARPTASSLNAAAGSVVNNLVLAKIGTAGKVCIYSRAATDLVVDVGGFVPEGSGFGSIVPARLFESRTGAGLSTVDGLNLGGGRIAAGAVVQVQIAGRGGVPDDAAGAVLNTAAIFPDSNGYLTLFPCDQDRPLAASVNYAPGQVRANAAFVKLDGSGRVCVFSSAFTDVTIDVVGATRDG